MELNKNEYLGLIIKQTPQIKRDVNVNHVSNS